MASVQSVIDNLRISHVEVRTEDDPEVAPHTHARVRPARFRERVVSHARKIAREARSFVVARKRARRAGASLRRSSATRPPARRVLFVSCWLSRSLAKKNTFNRAYGRGFFAPFGRLEGAQSFARRTPNWVSITWIAAGEAAVGFSGDRDADTCAAGEGAVAADLGRGAADGAPAAPVDRQAAIWNSVDFYI